MLIAIVASVTVLLIGCSNTDRGGTAGSNGDSQLKEVEVLLCENIMERYVQCTSETSQEDIQAAKESCSQQRDPETLKLRNSWNIDFREEYSECTEMIIESESDDPWNPSHPGCEKLEDLNDYCYPLALTAIQGGALDDEVFQTCLHHSENCEQLASLGFNETGDVSKCLEKWAGCEDRNSSSGRYWTEDYCLFIVALVDEQRAAAEKCIALPCGEVADCLYEAGAINI